MQEATLSQGLPAGVSDEVMAPFTDADWTDDRTVAEHLADAALATHTHKALLRDQVLRGFDFTAQAYRGHVFLRGAVQTDVQQQRAVRVAGTVPGVRRVLSALERDAQAGTATATTGRRFRRTRALADTATYHTVARGQTLWDIAQDYNLAPERIRQLNSLEGDALIPGQRLLVR